MLSRKRLLILITLFSFWITKNSPGLAQENPTSLYPDLTGNQEELIPSAYKILQNRRVQDYLKAETEPILSAEAKNDSLPSSLDELSQLLGQATLSERVLDQLDSLDLKSGYFTENLTVLGKTSLGATAVSGPLSQDGTLIIDGGQTINVIGETLSLQSLGLGGIDFIDGKMSLDREGNLSLAGDLTLGGDLQVGGRLSLGGTLTTTALQTDVISPLAQSGLTIQLGAPDASPTGFWRPEARLVVTNRKEEERLSIDEGGDLYTLGNLEGENLIARHHVSTTNLDVRKDLTVGGRAEFETLATKGFLRGKELILEKGLRIDTSRSGPNQETGTAASAGQTTFPAGLFSLTIKNSVVTRESLIYLTPAGSFEDQAPFVRSILPGRSFTVGVEHPLAEPVPFNWLIIN